MFNIAENFVRLVLIGGFFCVLEAIGLAILGFRDPRIFQVYTKAYAYLASLTGTLPILSAFFGAITLGVIGLFLDLAGTWIPGVHESRIFRDHIIKNKTWMDRFILNSNEYAQEDWRVLMEEINESKLYSLTPSGMRGFIPGIELWGGLKFAFNRKFRAEINEGRRERTKYVRPYQRLQAFMFSYIQEKAEDNKGELGNSISFWHTTQAIASAFFASAVLLPIVSLSINTKTIPGFPVYIYLYSALQFILCFVIARAAYSRMCTFLFAKVYATFSDVSKNKSETTARV